MIIIIIIIIQQTAAVATQLYLTGLPWIWIYMDISMDISMCGYQT